jgi:integrase
MLERRALKAGLEAGRTQAHALRHSLAMRMHVRLPAAAVQAQLGHVSLATTSRYLAHLSAQDLAVGLAAI